MVVPLAGAGGRLAVFEVNFPLIQLHHKRACINYYTYNAVWLIPSHSTLWIIWGVLVVGWGYPVIVVFS